MDLKLRNTHRRAAKQNSPTRHSRIADRGPANCSAKEQSTPGSPVKQPSPLPQGSTAHHRRPDGISPPRPQSSNILPTSVGPASCAVAAQLHPGRNKGMLRPARRLRPLPALCHVSLPLEAAVSRFESRFLGRGSRDRSQGCAGPRGGKLGEDQAGSVSARHVTPASSTCEFSMTREQRQNVGVVLQGGQTGSAHANEKQASPRNAWPDIRCRR